jgi:hypothetical protein
LQWCNSYESYSKSHIDMLHLCIMWVNVFSVKNSN